MNGVQIAVTFPMNRFHGAEWPCSPARLFRALLAGSMTGGYRTHAGDVESALRWLESQDPPEISAVEGRPLQKYRISVPNNDLDVAAREWLAGKVYDPAQLKTLKTVEPVELSGDGPHITFDWRNSAPEPEIVAGLRLAVESLHTLGWGIDMAFADLKEGNPKSEDLTTWRPSGSGKVLLQIPIPGSLEDLQATYQRFLNATTTAGVDADTRPSVYGLQRYADKEPGLGHVSFELSRVDEPQLQSYPAEKAMVIAAWLRHGAATALREEQYSEEAVNAVALGHDDSAVNADRLIYLPICSVGNRYTDGRIRRVMIALRGKPEVLHVLKRKLNGYVLTDSAGASVCRLTPATDDKVTPQFLTPRREWATATPVILHGYNASRGIISERKTERLLAQSFEQAGYQISDIEAWAFQPAPFWSGTPGARSTPVPKHLAMWPRYHVWVRFKKKVPGPVLAGIGRHYGIGVFAGWD